MSLFSLNRIYKPNRHTPTPLTHTHRRTQTDTLSLFFCMSRNLSAPHPSRTHTRRHTLPVCLANTVEPARISSAAGRKQKRRKKRRERRNKK